MATGGQVSVKKEPGTEEDIEARIVALCEEHPDGIDGDMIKMALPHCTSAQHVAALNALLKANKIKVFRKKVQGQDQLVYRLQDASSSSSAIMSGDRQEKLVYQIIADAGSKGVWIRDIRLKTNLAVPQLNKLFKTMESKKLIKAVKPVAASKKKMYMLYDTEPDSSITGGAWYNDQKFDDEFADVLTHQCYTFLEKKAATAKEQISDSEPLLQHHGALATAEEIHEFVSQSRLFTVKLTVNDIRDVLQALVYDGKVKEVLSVSVGKLKDKTDKLYRMARPLIQTTGLMKVPCGYCPLIRECRDDGPISPATCVYMKEWLEKLDF